MSLRQAWKLEKLPTWALRDTGLPSGSTLGELDSGIWKTMHSFSARFRNYLIRFLGSRRHQIVDRPVFAVQWPLGFDPARLPMKVRTRNALESSKLFESETALSQVTYGELFRIKGMGALSVLDFACAAENAIGALTSRVASSEVGALATLSASDSEIAPAQFSTAQEVIAEPDDRLVSARKALFSLLGETWVHQISEQDPRFAPLLPPGEGTIAERIEALLTAPPTAFFADEVALEAAIPKVRREYERIDALPLDAALREYLSALMRRTTGPRLDALIARFGWAGRPPQTLEEAAKKIGVTRERIRQIQNRILDRIPDHEIVMPALDRALELIQSSAPLSAEAAGKLLVECRISQMRFHPTSLLEVCKACRRTPPFQVARKNLREFVTTNSLQAFASPVIRVAHIQAGASGVSNVQELIEECLQKRIGVTETDVREVLRGLSDVEFLTDDWFWRPNGKRQRNRLRNVTRKMLSVSSSIGLGELREGVRREYSWRVTRGPTSGGWRLLVPSRPVLEAFYRANPEFAVSESGLVSSVEPLDDRVELAKTEQILVRVLRASPTCILDRAGLQKGCIESGMNENTFSVYSSYSPIIEHLGTDLWTLRGVHVDPAAVEAIRAANLATPRQRRVVDHGWTKNGHLWIGVRLPSSMRSFIFSIPGAVRRLVENREFSALSEKGLPCGSIRVNSEGACYGFADFLKRSGADENDILVSEFDIEDDVVKLRLGGDELLEEYSPDN